MTSNLSTMLKSVRISDPRDETMKLTIVIFGATGDLAKRKLFPSLYQLMYGCPDAAAGEPLLPAGTQIVGYGRSKVELSSFLSKQCALITGPRREDFLKRVSYFQGGYDKEDDFARLDKFMSKLEGNSIHANRIFFLSVPPTVFGIVCENIHKKARAICGFTRLIIEKPFGRDSRTFAELNETTSRCFREDQLYRIDHYLAKEKVLNLVAFRFGNQLYEPLWNNKHIEQVEIVFKENLGTEGRGGYFDEFGIIRDMMQNHLLQVMQWLAMEPPESLHPDHIAKEKCKLLEVIRTLEMKDCFLGQFTANSEMNEPGYLDDTTVPPGSKCPTFAACVLQVDNERWRGVPFMMRAGKGLDERLAEVRITFKKQNYNALVPSTQNQLVLRIQPDEGIFLKCSNKAPGWNHAETENVSLDMSYKKAFPDSYVAGAYERMLLNAAKGDQALFVGSGELVEAWRIFTPLLDEIDSTQPQPVLYPFGSKAPEGFQAFAADRGVVLEEALQEVPEVDKKTKRSSAAVVPSKGKGKGGDKGGYPNLLTSGTETRRSLSPSASQKDMDSDCPPGMMDLTRGMTALSPYATEKDMDSDPMDPPPMMELTRGMTAPPL